MLNKSRADWLLGQYQGVRKAGIIDERAYIRDESRIGFLQI